MESAIEACKNSGQPVPDHFVEVTEMIELAKGAHREVKTVYLSRYACYLIIQSADPRKDVVALGHSYFALQTRRQELEEQYLYYLKYNLVRNPC